MKSSIAPNGSYYSKILLGFLDMDPYNILKFCFYHLIIDGHVLTFDLSHYLTRNTNYTELVNILNFGLKFRVQIHPPTGPRASTVEGAHSVKLQKMIVKRTS